MSEPLYEIVSRYQADLSRLQDMDLPAEVVLDTMEAMQGEIEDKVRAVVAYAIQLEKAADARTQEAERMAKSAQAMEHRADALKLYAQVALMNSGLRLPMIAPEFTLNLAKLPPSVEVTDTTALPDSMVKTTVTIQFPGRVPDTWAISEQAPPGAEIEVKTAPAKKLIGDDLKSEVEVPGAKLAPVGYRLTVR